MIDRYTHVVLNFLEGINQTSHTTLQDLFSRYSFEDFRSNAGVRTDLYPRRPDSVRLTEFFGGVAEVDTEGVSIRTDTTGVEGESLPSTRLNKKERKLVERKTGHKTQPIAIPLPAIKPFILQSSLSNEEMLAQTRQTRSLHVETGVVLLLGHAVCWVLWQCYKLGMFASR